MNPRRAANLQRGAALLVMVAIIGLGATWVIVTDLRAASGGIEAVRKQQNAEMLNRAKQALVGYVALQASKSFENDPGRLPCPEPAGSFGIAATEGIAAASCTLPAVGRLPWRTLGLDKLTDAAGEPLWYVVASGWAKPSGTVNTLINSSCADAASTLGCATGQLTVDGLVRNAVALIIAPGPAISVQATGGCTAISQVRPEAGPLNHQNYLECDNATSPADSSFVSTGPGNSFNDQVVKVTAAELLPGIEAAVAHRMEREIVPLLRTAYAGTGWGLGAAEKVYPYPSPFANPETSGFVGSSAVTQGQFPSAHSQAYPGSTANCTAGAAAPRCNPTLVSWSNAAPTMSSAGVGVTLTAACSYMGPTSYGTCNGTYTGLPTQLTISGPQSNGAMSLRQVNASADTAFFFSFDLTSFAFASSNPTPSIRLNTNGTFTVSLTVTPPAPLGLAGVMYWFFVPGNSTTDHVLLDARQSSDTSLPAVASTSWFARNQWHKLLHYAVAPGYTAAGASPRSCTTGANCLTVANIVPVGAQRATLILAGRRIGGQTRPSATPSDYLEFGNASGGYERQPVSMVVDAASKKPFNDRFVVVESN